MNDKGHEDLLYKISGVGEMIIAYRGAWMGFVSGQWFNTEDASMTAMRSHSPGVLG